MADEVKAQAVPVVPPEAKNDLAAQLGVKTVKLVDKDSVEHRLPPLDMEDMSDLEEILGEDWLQENKLRAVSRILWTSLRKEGLSREDLVARKWKLKPQEVGMMFDARHGPIIRAAVTDLLIASGFERKPQGGGNRPSEGASEPTGAPS